MPRSIYSLIFAKMAAALSEGDTPVVQSVALWHNQLSDPDTKIPANSDRNSEGDGVVYVQFGETAYRDQDIRRERRGTIPITVYFATRTVAPDEARVTGHDRYLGQLDRVVDVQTNLLTLHDALDNVGQFQINRLTQSPRPLDVVVKNVLAWEMEFRANIVDLANARIRQLDRTSATYTTITDIPE